MLNRLSNKQISNTNKFLDTLLIVQSLAKKQSDIYSSHTDWLILQEEKLELLLIKAFNDNKKEVLKRFDEELPSVYNKTNVVNFIKELNTVPLEPRVDYQTFGMFRFYKHTFSVEIRDWMQKSGTGGVIDSISRINPDPFVNALDDVTFTSVKGGGQSVFSIFDIRIDFALRDKDAERYIKNFNLKLSSQVSKQLQSKIKFVLLEGIKNGDSIPHLRNKILDVFNKPIDVVVAPKLDAFGNTIRQGYSYQITPKQWANTVARTETSRAYNVGRLDGFAQTGVVDRVQFSTSPDERLCPVCAPLEGTVYKLADAVDYIPQHPNCRCQWIPLLSKDDFFDVKSKAAENAAALYSFEDRMSSEFPNIRLSGMENIPAPAKEEIYSTLKAMDSNYGVGFAEKTLTDIMTFKEYEKFVTAITAGDKQSSYAFYHHYRNRKIIAFNDISPKYYKDPKSFQRLMDQDVKVNWHPKGTNNYNGVLTHEQAHAIHDYIERAMIKVDGEYMHADDVLKKMVKEINKQNPLFTSAHVSRYSNENYHEFIAEIMGQYRTAPQLMTAKSKQVAERIDKVFKAGISWMEKTKVQALNNIFDFEFL